MNRSIALVITVIVLVLVMLGRDGIDVTSAQQPTSTPDVNVVVSPTPVVPGNLEERILKLELAQAESFETLKLANEYNRNISTFMGGLISLIVLIQTVVTFTQLRREGNREEIQRQRERIQDTVERAGAKQVSDIMTVVQQTLESRLLAEQAEREKARKAEEQLADVTKKFERLDTFYQSFQSNIRRLRSELETDAYKLATSTSRHDFRRIPDHLMDFSRRFDRFMNDYKGVEEEDLAFAAHVPYIRGIAAHYANLPAQAEEYLKQVVSRQNPETGEELLAYNRRVANSYYYLGLNESNFGRYDDAILYFETGNKLDNQSRDFLTKVVIAEAYVMLGEFGKADQVLSDVTTRMQEIEDLEGGLKASEFRLKSRLALIQANMLILRRSDNWRNEARGLLEPVRERDRSYYYLTATLAQLYHALGDVSTGNILFQEVYETILTVTDIHVIREARSKILLLMIAGLAAKSIGHENQAKEYLDQARNLCKDLPTIGSRACTVFSTLSKRNESSELISHHIDLIAGGTALL